jgi:sugar phosphate isomerase/epimerase
VSDSNRLEPGAGHLDWAAVLEVLATVGFDHPLAFECRLSGAPAEVLPVSAAFLRSAAGREVRSR